MEHQIIKILESNIGQTAMLQYESWHIASSACWLGLGIFFAILAVVAWRNRDEFDFSWIACFFLSVMAGMLFAIHVPVLLHPKAYAIHQLILDLSK